MSLWGKITDGAIVVGATAGAVACFATGNIVAGAALTGVAVQGVSGFMNEIQAEEQTHMAKKNRSELNAANRKTMTRQRQSITLQKNRAREAAAINSMAQGSAAKTNEHFAEVANRKAQNQVEMLSKTEHSRAQRYYGKSLH